MASRESICREKQFKYTLEATCMVSGAAQARGGPSKRRAFSNFKLSGGLWAASAEQHKPACCRHVGTPKGCLVSVLLPRSLCAAGHAGTAPAVERRLAFSLFPPARLDTVSLLRSPALQPPSNHSPTPRRCRQNGWSACWAPSAAAVRVASRVCGWSPTACPMAAWRPRYCARLPNTRAATQDLACQART